MTGGGDVVASWAGARQDLRDRVRTDAGRPARAVVARFGVSASYAVKTSARLRDAGEAVRAEAAERDRLDLTRKRSRSGRRSRTGRTWLRPGATAAHPAATRARHRAARALADGIVAPLVLEGAISGPDSNHPIEQVFAKLKALLRDAAARHTEALRTALGRLLPRFPPAERARYLAHRGYGRSG